MAGNILSTLLSKSSVSLINSTSGETVIANGRKSRLRVKFSSALMRHRMEDGSTTSDTRIILPTKVEMDLFAPDLDTFEDAVSLTIDRLSFYAVSAKGLYFDWMMVEGADNKYSPQVLSATPVTLKFKQVLLQNVDQTQYVQAADSKLVDKGILLSNNAVTTVGTIVTKVKNLL